MPDFLAQYLTALRQHREQLLQMLGNEPNGEVERALRDGIVANWMPTLESAAYSPRACFAVDGADAFRSFDNGTFLIVSHALLAGPEFEAVSTNVVLHRDTLSPDSLDRLRGLSTRALEVGLALDNAACMKDGVLYLDGSIYAQLGHLIYPFEASTYADLPLVTLERYLDLMDTCRQTNTLLVAISKTTRGHLLAHTFLVEANAGKEKLPYPRRRDWEVSLPSDSEVLARWTQGVGRTTPILVGWEAFGHRASQIIKSPTTLVTAFERAGLDRGRVEQTITRLRELPAIFVFYLRFDQGDDCVRIEIPADRVMVNPPRIVEIEFQFGSLNVGHEVISQVVADYSGKRVYNTALYVADHVVRLPRATVDEKYLLLLRQELGMPFRLNRSDRRFH